MKNLSEHGTPTTRVAMLVLLPIIAGLAAGSLTAAAPPEGKTYFTISVGVDGRYGPQVDCLTFSATDVCTSSGLCGSWERTEPPGPTSACAFEFSFEQDGVNVEIEGQGRIDDRGKNDSLGAAVRAQFGRKSVNYGIAGRSIKPRKCEKLLRDWTRRYPPSQVPQEADCLEHAVFGGPADSEYILPFPVGADYRLNQTYCYSNDLHRTWLAYDFSMPIGSKVIAARAGMVRQATDESPDDGDPDHDPNQIWIEHDDGTAALYAHLKQHGALVAPNQRVEQGQVIAHSGYSGGAGRFPHLHFQVVDGWPANWPPTLEAQVPLNFRNVLGPRDERGILIQEVYYKALRD